MLRTLARTLLATFSVTSPSSESSRQHLRSTHCNFVHVDTSTCRPRRVFHNHFPCTTMNRLRHPPLPPIPSNNNSLLRCYSLSKSVTAFQVVTPQIGYKAIFVRMPDKTLMEPDMLLMMPRESLFMHSYSSSDYRHPSFKALWLCDTFEFLFVLFLPRFSVHNQRRTNPSPIY